MNTYILSNKALVLSCKAVVNISHSDLQRAAVKVDQALENHAVRLTNNIFSSRL